MTNKKDINAGIIIIGNEILSGRTKDTNTSTLATWLNSLGIKVEEVRVIPDKKNIIIETVNLFRNKFNYFFIKTFGCFNIFNICCKTIFIIF